MPDKKNEKVSDFRYDTGEARVPWAAVGEHVREDDILALVKFLLRPARGEQKQYDVRLNKVAAELRNLGAVSTPAGKLSLAGNVQALEEATARFLGAKHTVFLTNATAGFEIAFKYANLKPGDEVIAPAITFIATIAYPLALGARSCCPTSIRAASTWIPKTSPGKSRPGPRRSSRSISAGTR